MRFYLKIVKIECKMKLTKFFLVWIFSKCCSNEPKTFSFNGLVDIIRFHMSIIYELVFSIILHLNILYILMEGEYYILFTHGFFHKLSTTLLA